MNQTIPPPPKGYRIITEDERKALYERVAMQGLPGPDAFAFSKDDQKFCGPAAFGYSAQFTYAIRYDEWIPWDGKDFCPLPVGTKVDVRLKNGSEETTNVEAAKGCNMTDSGFWARDNSIFSVTAYRVHEPEQVNEIPNGYVCLNPEYEPAKEPEKTDLKLDSPLFHDSDCDLKLLQDMIDSLKPDYAKYERYIPSTPQPQLQTNENTMATTTDATPVGSVGYSLPEIGSKWAYYQHGDSKTGKILSVGSNSICILIKRGVVDVMNTDTWNKLSKTQIYTRKELRQMAKQNRPGNIIVKTGGSRKRWFLIGAAAMYVGKPYLPAAAYHVMQFINSL